MTGAFGRLLHAPATAVVDALIPRRCGLCGRFDTFLCTACADRLPRALPPRCATCWSSLTPGRSCGGCARVLVQSLDGVRSVFCLDGGARELVHLVKYDGRFALARPMGAAMAQALTAWGIAPDALVPVPLHRSRQRQRGFNQSAALARACAEASGLPVLDRALERVRRTTAQVRIGGVAARHQNMQGAFVSRGGVAGRTLLLIDDVCTTGATLRACADAVRDGGARRVYALTFAKED